MVDCLQPRSLEQDDTGSCPCNSQLDKNNYLLKSGKQKIIGKFSFDGGGLTGNGIQGEIGTIQLLWEGMSLSMIKSPNTAHQFLLFFGAEDRKVSKTVKIPLLNIDSDLPD